MSECKPPFFSAGEFKARYDRGEATLKDAEGFLSPGLIQLIAALKPVKRSA